MADDWVVGKCCVCNNDVNVTNVAYSHGRPVHHGCETKAGECESCAICRVKLQQQSETIADLRSTVVDKDEEISKLKAKLDSAHRLFPEKVKELTNKWFKAEDEAKVLRTLVEPLPLTADGVRVVPGATKVWKITKGKPEESLNWNGWFVLFRSDVDWSKDNDNVRCHRDVTKCCYSSEAAALAAIKEGKTDE